MSKVQFYKHHLGPAERAAVDEVLQSLFLTTGPRTGEFEEALGELLGVPHVVGVTSCTIGLFLALKAADVGPGDEVITTPMTFIATPNAILHTGATPAFVDVDERTGNIDLERVATAITPRTKAIMPVHLYGQMVDMRALRSLADEHKLVIIEDAAHAVEAERDGVRPGQLGDFATFSFYATKNITCGEGGAITTRDPEMNARLRALRLHGMTKGAYQRYAKEYRHWDMTELGFKANMSDLSAALLLPQLGGIEERLQRREAVAAMYDAGFAGDDRVDTPSIDEGARSSRHLYTIWVASERRDEILSELQAKDIGVAVNYRAVHLLEYYRREHGGARGQFPNAERIGDRTISLPFYPAITDEEVQRVIETVRSVV
ncbi:MAG: DegT/DnrJ/EryC1/StrS family aminotransferase [Myxococcota bacterium]